MAVILGIFFICLGLVVLIVIALYPRRNEIPSREYCFKKYHSIWGLWYTGRETLKLELIQKYPDRVKKLLLLNPKSDGFAENMKQTSGEGLASRKNIIKLTQLAQKYGIPVKWYDFFYSQTLSFYNPESPQNAWLLVTDARKTPVDSRPKHKYTRKDKCGEYGDKLTTFNDIWENKSSEPNINDGDSNNEERIEN